MYTYPDIHYTLGRGPWAHRRRRTGRSAHFKRWMNDAAFKRLVNKSDKPA